MGIKQRCRLEQIYQEHTHEQGFSYGLLHTDMLLLANHQKLLYSSTLWRHEMATEQSKESMSSACEG